MWSSRCSLPDTDSGPGANPLEGTVRQIIKNLSGKEALTAEDIISAWEAAAGKAAAKHSRPVSFKKKEMVVNVDRSPWLYELTTRKKEILKKIEDKLKGRVVQEIRLRIGDITK